MIGEKKAVPHNGDEPHAAEVSRLTVVLGRRRTAKQVLDGLDLRIGTGVHGLLGPNGAGKTTLMRVLATVIPPSAGFVTVLGRSIEEPKDRRAIRRSLGYLPQSFGFHPRFTVREFVAYFAWLKEYPAKFSPRAVEHALKRVNMAPHAETQMRKLSGGMLRRAGLAQALVNDPELLLLDEPTAGLDPEQRVQLRETLRQLGASTAVLVATHLVEDVASACSRVSLLNDGQVVWDGEPSALAELSSDQPSDGASAIETGYTLALREHRARRAE